MGNITGGRTNLTMQSFVTRLQSEDHDYFAGMSDFISPMTPAIIKYAKSYTGTYYRNPSGPSCAATAFSAPQETGSFGNYYEENVPADCIDGGINGLEVFYSTGGSIPNASVQLNAAETAWVTDATNTTVIYARQCGRRMRAYIPTPIASCTGIKYLEDYTRYPVYPTALTDVLDAPADDTDTLYGLWKPTVQKN